MTCSWDICILFIIRSLHTLAVVNCTVLYSSIILLNSGVDSIFSQESKVAEVVQSIKSLGNNLFKEQKYKEARNKYKKALRYIYIEHCLDSHLIFYLFYNLLLNLGKNYWNKFLYNCIKMHTNSQLKRAQIANQFWKTNKKLKLNMISNIYSDSSKLYTFRVNKI